MKLHLILLAISFCLTYILLIILLPLLKRLKAGQYILGYVKVHKQKNGTPTMGGLAIIAAIAIITFAAYGFENNVVNFTITITIAFAFVGFIDDFLKIKLRHNEGLKPYQKIIFQLAISAMAGVYCYFNDITLLNIPLTFGKSINIGVFIIPLVIVAFISTVNCVNLTDGLDGLAGSTSLSFLLAMALMLAVSNDNKSNICFIAVGSLAAFLVLNTNKAAIFMGDTGSLSLGGLIASICTFSQNVLYIPLIGIMFVASGISVIVQVIYYKRTGRRIFLMAPLHHHLQMKGYTECKISYVYAIITAFIGIICLIFM
jgi:phospho-N-acetylmuramoyl-pentapeptide-transferase